MTVEVLPLLWSVIAHIPRPASWALPSGRARDLQWWNQNKAATVTGGSEGHQLKLTIRPPSFARNCTMLVVLHLDAVWKKDVALLYVQKFHFSGDSFCFFFSKMGKV